MNGVQPSWTRSSEKARQARKTPLLRMKTRLQPAKIQIAKWVMSILMAKSKNRNRRNRTRYRWVKRSKLTSWRKMRMRSTKPTKRKKTTVLAPRKTQRLPSFQSRVLKRGKTLRLPPPKIPRRRIGNEILDHWRRKAPSSDMWRGAGASFSRSFANGPVPTVLLPHLRSQAHSSTAKLLSVPR